MEGKKSQNRDSTLYSETVTKRPDLLHMNSSQSMENKPENDDEDHYRLATAEPYVYVIGPQACAIMNFVEVRPRANVHLVIGSLLLVPYSRP